MPLNGDAKFYKIDFGQKFGSRQVSRANLEAQNGELTLDLTVQ